MKRIALFIIVCATNLVTPAKAQFLKNMTNDIKQTLQNRANGKTNQATNHLLDKVDSAIKNSGTKGGNPATTGSGAGRLDTSGISRVLGAFAKTARDNPNDTNPANLVMKSLGRLAGGDGVSPQDSAKAIRSFTTAGGGTGVLYESTVIITSKRGTTRDTTYSYLTNNGEGRAEMCIPIPGVKTPKFIVIGRANEPTYSITLDADTKTYSLNVIDTALINSGISNYQVTRIGAETVNGYSCIHSRLVTTTGAGMFKTTSTMDIWTSTSVPGYALYSRLLTFQSSQGGLLGALNKAGAGGFMVKMTAGDGKEFSMTTQLIKVEQRSFPSSMFAIPAGYSNSAVSTPERLLSGSSPVSH